MDSWVSGVSIIRQVSLTGLGSEVVRASAYGMGGPGFDSRGQVIPKTLKIVVMASLLDAQELTVNNTTDSLVSV